MQQFLTGNFCQPISFFFSKRTAFTAGKRIPSPFPCFFCKKTDLTWQKEFGALFRTTFYVRRACLSLDLPAKLDTKRRLLYNRITGRRNRAGWFYQGVTEKDEKKYGMRRKPDRRKLGGGNSCRHSFEVGARNHMPVGKRALPSRKIL